MSGHRSAEVTAFTESIIEQSALARLECVGWRTRKGAEIAPGEIASERNGYGQVVRSQGLRDALEDAFRKFTRPGGTDLIVRNRAWQRLLELGDAAGG